MGRGILVIDQGTTSTRGLVFDHQARRLAAAQVELPQHYPAPGLVEHEPEDIWQGALAAAREGLARSGLAAAELTALAITNQRETTLLWDRATGVPVHRAVVWQDRRGAERCRALRAAGVEPWVRERTGLVLDPYFSATKLAWLLDHVPGARARAERGELAFGTVDSFLLWRLTGGAVHATDPTNAGRTLLFDVRRGEWDDELCRLFGVPPAVLPAVHDNAHLFGVTEPALLGAAVPIAGMAGDQQAALFGQCCFAPGAAKATFGTGCFLLVNAGEAPPAATGAGGLLVTPAWRAGGRTSYALEGAIFAAGATLTWLRDGLGVLPDPAQADALAAAVPDDHGVYLVPAFAGLGAPHWDPHARGAVYGLTLGTTAAHLVRAGLEAAAFQAVDLVEAAVAGGTPRPPVIRVDGGMSASDRLCGFLADLAAVPIERAAEREATARGAAFHAGFATGVWGGQAELARLWSPDHRFAPALDPGRRAALLAGWREAVRRTLGGPAGAGPP